MDTFFLINILYAMLTIVGTCLILIDFYIILHHGKFIIKLKENKALAIFWVVLLLIWGTILGFNMTDYSQYGEDKIRNSILLAILWIVISITNIIKSWRGSEIREKGIYTNGYFYKWSRIMSYSWKSTNIIQLKVNTFLKINRSLKIIIKEELKLKVDEIMQRNIDL